eukprot:TRINITY_DN730_c0_g1::TRINITY_DN730_c0_g1_i1::g.18447::m.18447 TRINITY_DN730_c0_g1::TRINITY_DN730_c0_g1_i1::g.18447  ORF type:complete len:463 (+),score=172.06,sp/P34255/YKA3_CAEEL/58.31/3e-171,Thiolase_N/PF00108.18/1.3e-78,Thiolase_N/PF00108.18/4e+02,Thiolase_N/PF00108.18/2.8e+03,Thiolase_C/PF02803.13/6e+02,Thiolase_C/PF02803.13/8.8e-41,ketoacyl-synt/PF00109.21/1.7e-05,ketoacyl-synt/PF00109.21/2.3e+03 TRINITY_DN730_c0_g1_i1:88-1476(+)
MASRILATSSIRAAAYTVSPVQIRAFATAAPASKKSEGRRAVLIDAVRLPFQKSGTAYADLIAYDLQREALKNLLSRTAVDPKSIEGAICGTVVQETKTSNIAREAVLGAGLSDKIPAYTVTMACISSNLATTMCQDKIRLGLADVMISGGVETMSDVPIRFNKKFRKFFLDVGAFKKLKTPQQMAARVWKDKLFFPVPEPPAIAEFSTGEVMGHSADRLAAMFNVSRKEQDEFAARSHQNAAKAVKAGLLDDVTPLMVPNFVKEDNVFRADATAESLGKLNPAFIKPHGTVTAGNASTLTDGASAALVMSEERAKAMGLVPKAVLGDYIFTAQDPKDELLLGPAYAIQKLLARNGLTIKDVDVWEIHEAFAGQVLANLNALDSEKFCKEKMGAPGKVGRIDMDKINTLGGSLSLGHPFGATGIRLIATCANRLKRENGRIAVLAACAAGGQAVAQIIHRYD